MAEYLTARLRLRPWREEDGLELARLFGDPDVVGGRDFSLQRIARFHASTLRQWRVNGFGPWAALDRATGAWIGRIGLDDLEDFPEDDKIEVGFEIGKAWWGRGLATEGARAALDAGFGEHALERIISVTAATHVSARRVMEKAGLTYHHTRVWMNSNVPVVVYAIDRATWLAARSASSAPGIPQASASPDPSPPHSATPSSATVPRRSPPR